MKRRHLLLASAGVTGVALLPEARLFAQQAQEFIEGPAVADIPAQQLSKHVWMIYSPDGFPTPQNRGMMANIIFVVTSVGVVVIDSGASLQIGQMAIRMIRKVTDKPVVAVFNSHYHGDHWLGNHAFVKTYGDKLPIYSLASSIAKLKGAEANLWRGLMERWTNQSTMGTQVVIPNTAVQHGQVIQFGDVSLRMHHYGTAHTPSDLSVEIVQDKVTAVGDIAMTNRIANMDEGSYPGTFKYYKALMTSAGEQLWVPGHGRARHDLLKTYGDFMAGIWEPSLKAVEDGKSEAEARAAVMKDTRVASRAKTMDGFEGNIGKYISLAYLEAEKIAF
jgi:glyoxylase-like metal-dependent hydrolase (beta-lactamase superfamily II)